MLHVTFTFTHTHCQRLFSDRFVREHTDPDLTLTLNCTGHSTTCCFDLTCSQTTTANSFQTEAAEANIRTLRQTAVTEIGRASCRERVEGWEGGGGERSGDEEETANE